MNKTTKKILVDLAQIAGLIAAALLVWYVAAVLTDSELIVPDLWTVFRLAFELLGQGAIWLALLSTLARAFAVDRPVLLLDEPFRSLDLGVRRKLYSTLNELLGAFSKIAVLVTHDVDEAVLLADRIYLLSGRPAKLQAVAEISMPRSERDEYSLEFAELRKTLRSLLLIE